MPRMKKTTEQFKKEVYDLVGDEYTVLGEYINSDTKIMIRHNCDKCNNYEFETRPHNFLRGTRCPKCFSKNNKKTTEQFKKEVYDLVGDEYTVLGEYIGNNKPIKIRHNCDKCNNYEFKANSTSFLRGTRCPKCSGKMKKSTGVFKEEVYDLVGDEYTVLGEYKNNKTKIKIKHEKCGNIFEMIPNNFISQNQRCPYCNGNIKFTNIEFREKVKELFKEEYTVLEDYVNYDYPIKVRHNCDKCNNYEWYTRPHNFLSGKSSCPYCSNYSRKSKKEKEIINFIKNDLNIELIESDRNTLDGKELDILINDIAFEFDGLYWHSELYKENNYHIYKTNLCKDKGIRLFHIFEDEWDDKSIIVKSKIANILNCNKNLPKIYARKCYIKEIDSKNKNKFLEDNHIQGRDTSNIKLGLFYDEQLVSVMTFIKPRRSLGQKDNSKYDYELSRFASDINYHVVGSFSKLFKYFERNYEWNKIITYADRRWSEGNVYIKNGWNHTHDSKPNYWYCISEKRYHRYNFRKQVLKEKFPDLYDENLTEFEIMDRTKYVRIWDCGNMVFEYIKE